MLTFVAFDTETTGLTPVVDRIVEIGAVRFRGDEILRTFDTLVDPERPISKGASVVNGITDEMVRGKPNIGEVLPEWIQFIGDAIPVAHHAPFDVGFLSYDISRLNLAVKEQPVLNTCAMARRLFPYAASFSLENLALFFDIRSKTFHRALADAVVCMEIFKKCLSAIGKNATMDQILSTNGPYMSLAGEVIVLDERHQPIQTALLKGDNVEIS